MKKIILILILLPISSIAQNWEGRVFDKKNKLPIENVNITTKLFDGIAVTDEKGKFIIQPSNKLRENDTLTFSHIGYTTKKMTIKEIKQNEFSVFLDENEEQLNDVTIISPLNKQLKSKIDYTKLAPLKYALSYFGSVLKDNKIYVIGGDESFQTDAWKKVQYEKTDPNLNDYLKELSFQFSGQMYNGHLIVYDIKTNHWEVSKKKFRKRAYHNLNECNGKIYILGGKSISTNRVFEYLDNKIEVFDIDKQTISTDNTNPHQAANFASFTYNNSLIVIGGSVKMSENGTKEYTDKVHFYDINSGYWYELKAMPIGKETTGILIENKIYLFGGFNGKPLSTIESFDLATEKWKTEGNLFGALSNPAITSNNDVVYVFENEKIYTYNIHSKELKEYLINLPMKAAKLFFSDDKLYLIGGYIENYYSKYPSSNIFRIDISEFNNTKPNKTKVL